MRHLYRDIEGPVGINVKRFSVGDRVRVVEIDDQAVAPDDIDRYIGECGVVIAIEHSDELLPYRVRMPFDVGDTDKYWFNDRELRTPR